jgi:hypothetical protein
MTVFGRGAANRTVVGLLLWVETGQPNRGGRSVYEAIFRRAVFEELRQPHAIGKVRTQLSGGRYCVASEKNPAPVRSKD